MPIKLAISGRPAIEIDVENITIGSDRSCTVAFDDSTVMPRHAVIRKIAGRWLIEVREAPAVFIGGPFGHTEPKRLHWLVPGDQIHLTENGPAMTFEPPNSSAVPVVQSGTKSRAVEDVIDEVLMLREADETLPETTSTEAHNSVHSNPISTTEPPSTYAIQTADSGTPMSSTVTSPAAMGTGSQPSDARLPNQSSEEPATSGPVLSRVPWSEGALLQGDDCTNEELTPEQAEIRWIMTVVLRCFGAGLIVLVVWMIVSAIMKSSTPTKVSSLSAETVEQRTAIPREVTSSPTERIGPGAVQNATTKPLEEKHETKSTLPLTTKTEARDAERKPDAVSPDNSAKPVNPNGVGVNSKKTEFTNGESSSGANVTSQSPSPLIQAVQESIYAVIVEDPVKSRRIQIGTSWAATRRYLVTTATVVNRIEEHQQNGMIASVVHFANGKSFRIKGKRLHETYTKALESAEDAREKHDDERYSKDRATQLRFDLGVLDIGRNERLPYRLSIDPALLEDSQETVFMMVGLPFLAREDDSASVPIAPNSLKERRCKKLAAGIPPQDKEMGLTIQFPLDTNGTNWSGSPVLNRDQKVIGVYSQLLQPKLAGGTPMKPVHGVVWIGRLNEFAPDIENPLDRR